ncbi:MULTISPECIES: type 4a pilus biogenesis protein PilO [unclassified Pseudomonas]|uniref:type 4a pilus biogenesis protein PilO n=1 Tax=unclassified Pseudomonas TaxID=196821 RepID=UPI000BCAFDA4|nr:MULTISPECIES: type 4a pilus biogenesis protein PilO [unclassified Pseudomonas]PVZ09678.1 type IV pilus assembly protein PilO [Pseudomonas sp. URIL14HWK12:I12]PVZ21566.1 type IV pilus assembly protein PilO [Pseudomonas sp. URIL14HWK12:I10]PVZ30253.1 type IV pilus assembly protein PilO [Pseudomonas sp. URIL14HWK12:I11]SNZ18808.1 type IV pilus assembly protein PilO [Pseudomonas sp. URIL14HWK12:I9]
MNLDIKAWFASLREVQLSELDASNIGSWPGVIKGLCAVLLALLLLGLGYYFHLQDLEADLDSRAAQEEQLKQQYESKSFQAANLEAYTAQLQEMETTFGTMLRQLPSDTEVPGLLEDITRAGLGAGLDFEEIKLLPEVTQQFYVELPIQMTVTGSYHDLATFVSGISSLSRIVTLHDFDIQPADKDSTSPLRMTILAKTYRYNEKADASKAAPAAQGGKP